MVGGPRTGDPSERIRGVAEVEVDDRLRATLLALHRAMHALMDRPGYIVEFMGLDLEDASFHRCQWDKRVRLLRLEGEHDDLIVHHLSTNYGDFWVSNYGRVFKPVVDGFPP